MANSFRTTRGRCVVADGTVRFESDDAGRFGTVREVLTTDEIPAWRRLAVVLLVVAAVAGIALAVQSVPAWATGAAAGLLLALLGWSWYTGRHRPDPGEVTVPKTDVVGVDAHAGIPLLTRPRFVVRYRADGGVKHRYVRCPSRLYGFRSFETGRDLFERHGLLGADDAARAAADA